MTSKYDNLLIPINELPSRFLSYPNDAIVSYRPYNFNEILNFNQLADASKMEQIDLLDFALDGIHTNFDKHLLTYFDVIYIGILRKLSAFPEATISAEVECNCGEVITQEVSLSTLYFEDAIAESLPIKANVNNTDLEFSFITVKDVSKLTKFDSSHIFAKSIKNVAYDYAVEIVTNSTGIDAAILQEVDKQLQHNLRPLQFTCNKCKAVHSKEADNPELFIQPFRKYKELIRDRISFGNK